MWESSDGWLFAWATYECVLIRSSMLWRPPFTLLETPSHICMVGGRDKS